MTLEGLSLWSNVASGYVQHPSADPTEQVPTPTMAVRQHSQGAGYKAIICSNLRLVWQACERSVTSVAVATVVDQEIKPVARTSRSDMAQRNSGFTFRTVDIRVRSTSCSLHSGMVRCLSDDIKTNSLDSSNVYDPDDQQPGPDRDLPETRQKKTIVHPKDLPKDHPGNYPNRTAGWHRSHRLDRPCCCSSSSSLPSNEFFPYQMHCQRESRT